METITSPNNPRIKALAALAKKPAKDAFIVEGFHMVEVAESAGCLDEVYFVKENPVSSLPGVSISETALRRIAVAKNPEPVIGVAHIKRSDEYGDKVLVLDRVQDPGNIGTILRSAIAFGFEDVLFMPGTCSPMNSKVLASTQGAIFLVRMHFPETEEEAVKFLKEHGYVLIGSALQGASPMEEYRAIPDRFALVLGNEGQGMGESLKSSCDVLLKISMQSMESLNVGVAGGILMHHFSLTK